MQSFFLQVPKKMPVGCRGKKKMDIKRQKFRAALRVQANEVMRLWSGRKEKQKRRV
jgi:hypothetical protein